MLSREKVINHLMEHFEDTNSDKDRFIKDMLILIEFSNFEPEDEELKPMMEE
ncbi:hypothetical protein KIH86_03885 [Paenibacillus sp. HN-1]|uniref:hypothetical protein n=1 Tax=Paenibacillus TaxID=44249 RepID=UPI000F98C3FA|nr:MULTISPECIES: hypothetical protein [Paenibacillus]MBY9079548.1 hypothetical protein [Paenibacillus sp. CGMCC 1.18879]MBY9083369.1 hypothetical protein [Paenibacillus sinensis]